MSDFDILKMSLELTCHLLETNCSSLSTEQKDYVASITWKIGPASKTSRNTRTAILRGWHLLGDQAQERGWMKRWNEEIGLRKKWKIVNTLFILFQFELAHNVEQFGCKIVIFYGWKWKGWTCNATQIFSEKVLTVTTNVKW